GDHLDQLVAVKARLVQIGRPARRAWIATPVAIDTVAKLAIRFVAKQALAERHVLGSHRAETKDYDRRGDDQVASLHERIPGDGRRHDSENSSPSYSPNTNSMVWLRISRSSGVFMSVVLAGRLSPVRIATYCFPPTSKVMGGALKPTPTLIFQSCSRLTSS